MHGLGGLGFCRTASARLDHGQSGADAIGRIEEVVAGLLLELVIEVEGEGVVASDLGVEVRRLDLRRGDTLLGRACLIDVGIAGGLATAGGSDEGQGDGQGGEEASCLTHWGAP